ncbi:MAG: SWIM zinc finger family protein [Hamadaea sp.]|uniref:SWIM zinc finger family protein n=1 Tax=Hamadaea sp. TaxID=2024425 RepID=UPI00184746E9|nr:SWIM zinc finger family protein [Hamadaea sp.]NUR71677.1 SWIM zinc finger family protein [Hamadaea sp.]NUT18169.1 SWIM zinc finger family protein [Hamadaea sp.]
MSVASYAYARPSALSDGGLDLQTSGGQAANPRFFEGFVTTPQPVALGLLAVADVARTRYYQPTSRASLDPVVTGSRDMLRFESFSGCCGVYARMDVLPAGLDGRTPDHGTTNVDVNNPLRLSLSRISGLDPLHLAVGPDELAVSTMDGTLVERKVPLPGRWLRGFAEVAVIAAGMEPRASIGAAEAADFLRRLPNDRKALWVVPAGRSLRLTSRPVAGAVCVSGGARLATLRGLLRHATSLTVFGPPAGPGSPPLSSAWLLETPTVRLLLTLSPEISRGFSGEGAVLTQLADDQTADDADLVSAMLAWDPVIDVDGLTAACNLPPERVRAALTLLGTAGRVGFDVTEGAYFHRVMPFGTDAAARLNPRLAGARALVDAGAVRPFADRAEVVSGETTYQVRLVDGRPVGCTCQWWGKYRGGRGPCKHQLAALISVGALEEVAA